MINYVVTHASEFEIKDSVLNTELYTSLGDDTVRQSLINKLYVLATLLNDRATDVSTMAGMDALIAVMKTKFDAPQTT